MYPTFAQNYWSRQISNLTGQRVQPIKTILNVTNETFLIITLGNALSWSNIPWKFQFVKKSIKKYGPPGSCVQFLIFCFIWPSIKLAETINKQLNWNRRRIQKCRSYCAHSIGHISCFFFGRRARRRTFTYRCQTGCLNFSSWHAWWDPFPKEVFLRCRPALRASHASADSTRDGDVARLRKRERTAPHRTAP